LPVTTAGTEVEYFIQHNLEDNGYNVESQVPASGINQQWSQIDLVLYSDDCDTAEAVSLKYQDVGGTAEEKVLYEAESLSLMCYAHNYSQGTIVLCGAGWSPFKYYWFLKKYQPPSNVRVISYDEFVQEYIFN